MAARNGISILLAVDLGPQWSWASHFQTLSNLLWLCEHNAVLLLLSSFLHPKPASRDDWPIAFVPFVAHSASSSFNPAHLPSPETGVDHQQQKVERPWRWNPIKTDVLDRLDRVSWNDETERQESCMLWRRLTWRRGQRLAVTLQSPSSDSHRKEAPDPSGETAGMNSAFTKHCRRRPRGVGKKE